MRLSVGPITSLMRASIPAFHTDRRLFGVQRRLKVIRAVIAALSLENCMSHYAITSNARCAEAR